MKSTLTERTKKMVTKNDLCIGYSLSTGKVLSKYDADNFKDADYCKFIEDQLLEKLNEEKEREELFNQTAIFDNGQ